MYLVLETRCVHPLVHSVLARDSGEDVEAQNNNTRILKQIPEWELENSCSSLINKEY